MRRRTGYAFCLAGLALMAPGVARAQSSSQQKQPAFSAPAGSKNPEYDIAAQAAIPLTPGMIAALARRYHAGEKAAAAARTPQMVLPQTRSLTVSFGPGTVTSIIQTVQGYPSSIAFIDSTGSPWPVAWTGNSAPGGGNAGGVCDSGGLTPVSATKGGNGGIPAVIAEGFNVCVPEKGSNVLEIVPLSRYPRGGLLVNLQGAPAPLTFLLVSGLANYDARIIARIGERGPEARREIINRPNAPETGAPYLTAMLDGTPPASAVPLAVAGASPEAVRAWRYHGQLFLRTRDTILSPEWMASEHSVGGVGIYALPDTPVVLLSEGGQSFSISFKDD